MPTNQANYSMVCDGCVEIAVTVAAGAPTVTVGDTNGTLGTVTAGNNGTFNDYLWNGNTATISIADGQTVSSGAITGTIKYTNCPTPTATPAATPAPTPSPTPGGGGGVLPAGGGDCDNTVNWPSLGTKYQVTFPDTTTEWTYYDASASSKKLYMSVVGDPTTAIGGDVRIAFASDGTAPCFFDQNDPGTAADLLNGISLSQALSGKFSVQATTVGAVGTAWDIWIDN
jgi:hypothetical protein